MPGLQPVRRINFNDIKARLKRCFMFFEKHRSCGAQTLLLAKVYKLARRAEMRSLTSAKTRYSAFSAMMSISP